jgi:HD-GYP domain-containing protein (c-di-GMP phosphodiesterase class II)
VSEDQRLKYLECLCKNQDSIYDQLFFLKKTAAACLKDIFDKDLSTSRSEVIYKNIVICKNVFKCISSVLNECRFDSLANILSKLSFHDHYTYEHSVHVAVFSIGFFKCIKPTATEDELIDVGLSSLFHDLGKLKLPTSILNNPGDLTQQQFDEIKKHPLYGAEIISQLKNLSFGDDNINWYLLEKVALEHHENYDGTGYPHGIDSDRIHIVSRIVAIIDFFGAATSKRTYQETLSVGDALALMKKYSGKKLDPKLFQLFENALSSLIGPSKEKYEITEEFDPARPMSGKVIEKFGKVILIDPYLPRNSITNNQKVELFNKASKLKIG